jgi:hypothetical protein
MALYGISETYVETTRPVSSLGSNPVRWAQSRIIILSVVVPIPAADFQMSVRRMCLVQQNKL